MRPSLSFRSLDQRGEETNEILVEIGDFGALRIQMIGVDRRHQGTGVRHSALGRHHRPGAQLFEDVAVRFLFADANVRKVSWYEAAGFVRNQAEREVSRLGSERSVSMRLDLLEGLRDGGSPR